MKKTIRNPFVMLIVLVVAVCSLKGASLPRGLSILPIIVTT